MGLAGVGMAHLAEAVAWVVGQYQLVPVGFVATGGVAGGIVFVVPQGAAFQAVAVQRIVVSGLITASGQQGTVADWVVSEVLVAITALWQRQVVGGGVQAVL